jgi:hypothetical protein
MLTIWLSIGSNFRKLHEAAVKPSYEFIADRVFATAIGRGSTVPADPSMTKEVRGSHAMRLLTVSPRIPSLVDIDQALNKFPAAPAGQGGIQCGKIEPWSAKIRAGVDRR